MLKFKPTTLADRAWVVPLLRAEGIPLCSYNFTTFVCWQHVYHHEVCRCDDRLLVHAETAIGSAYLWPTGSGDAAPALRALEQNAKARGEMLRFVGILPEQLVLLERMYGERLEVIERRDNYDYLYDIDKLADLPGKKLHAKRNHIRRFRDNCPDGVFAPLKATDIPDCLALDERWYEEHLARAEDDSDSESLLQERIAMRTALEHFEELGMDGGLIRCKGVVLAFTLGSRLTDTVYDVQFERALSEFQGAFPVINQEFARYIRETYPDILQIDREEDMGNLGLRRAKLSYGPDRLVENFCVIVHDEKYGG